MIYKKFKDMDEILEYILESTEKRSLLYARKVANHYIQCDPINLVATTSFDIEFNDSLQCYRPAREVLKNSSKLNNELKKLFGDQFEDALSKIANAMIRAFEPDLNERFLNSVDINQVDKHIKILSSTIKQFESAKSELLGLISLLAEENLEKLCPRGVELFLNRSSVPPLIPKNISEIVFSQEDPEGYRQYYPDGKYPKDVGSYDTIKELEKFSKNLKKSREKMKSYQDRKVEANKSKLHQSILCLYGIFFNFLNGKASWDKLPFQDGNFNNVYERANRDEILAIKFVYQVTTLLKLELKPYTIWKIISKHRGVRRKGTNTRNGKKEVNSFTLPPVSYERFEGKLYRIEREHAEYVVIENYPKEDPWKRIDYEIKSARPKKHGEYQRIINKILLAK